MFHYLSIVPDVFIDFSSSFYAGAPFEMDMKDMSMASSRIYVGNLGDNVVSDALFEHFKGYGKILGIKRPMKKSYAFIQFDNDVSAHEAIKNEDQKSYHSRTLIVRAAVSGHNFTNKSK